MTLYRLYTERRDLPVLEALVSGRFDGYTLYFTAGIWRGLREMSVVVEILADDSPDTVTKVRMLVADIRVSLNQQAVLWTVQPAVQATLETGEPGA